MLNKLTAAMINAYADAWDSVTMNNQKAKKLTSDSLAIQGDEVKLMQYCRKKHDRPDCYWHKWETANPPTEG